MNNLKYICLATMFISFYGFTQEENPESDVTKAAGNATNLLAFVTKLQVTT